MDSSTLNEMVINLFQESQTPDIMAAALDDTNHFVRGELARTEPKQLKKFHD